MKHVHDVKDVKKNKEKSKKLKAAASDDQPSTS
jgi:hypothetical protein